jgi:hypothetical protein
MKLSVKCRILFFLLVAIIVSCDINIPEDWEYGDTVLRGIVVDKADSTPLDSVLFTLAYSKIMQNTLYQELTPKTDSTGTFRFDIYCMQEYAYRLGLKKEGYSQGLGVTFPFSIDSGKDNYFYMEMIKRDSTKVYVK